MYVFVIITLWDVWIGNECLFPDKISGASLNLIIPTSFCLERLISISMMTFCFSYKNYFLLFDLELCDM